MDLLGHNAAGIGMKMGGCQSQHPSRGEGGCEAGRAGFFQASAESLPTISALPETPTDWSRFWPPWK
jgi:hypothetical protein